MREGDKVMTGIKGRKKEQKRGRQERHHSSFNFKGDFSDSKIRK
jgi:hypothetical protein